MSKTAYLALYRKWRPQTFSDVVGQEHITRVLKSEVSSGSVSHAYLFCGSRGTGKTTCAKILAKAVNCETPEKGDPCGKCAGCLASRDSFDITEMDAASNNGVENIRDLRDKVVYPPAELKRRVYIIDEVHMLSPGAFNALLKTLEEPPSHVMFILATTEINKLPATILSRCKRFDFYRIPPETIANLLRKIADKEGINITEGALLLIARLAAGAMRDALSMLELFGKNAQMIDEEEAAKTLGVVGRGPVMRLLETIAKKEVSAALETVADAYEASKDMGILCGETGDALRDLLIVKYTAAPERYLDWSGDALERLRDVARDMTRERLLYCMEIIEETQNRLSHGAISRRATFETAVIKLCDPRLSVIPEAFLDRLSAVEEAMEKITRARALSDSKTNTRAAPPIDAPHAPTDSLTGTQAAASAQGCPESPRPDVSEEQTAREQTQDEKRDPGQTARGESQGEKPDPGQTAREQSQDEKPDPGQTAREQSQDEKRDPGQTAREQSQDEKRDPGQTAREQSRDEKRDPGQTAREQSQDEKRDPGQTARGESQDEKPDPGQTAREQSQDEKRDPGQAAREQSQDGQSPPDRSEKQGAPMLCYAEFLEQVKKKDLMTFSMLSGGYAELFEHKTILFVNSAAMFVLANAKSRQIITSALETILGYSLPFEMRKLPEEARRDPEFPRVDPS